MYIKNFKKLLLILFLLGIIGCNTEQSKGEYLRQGIKLIENGELAKAEIEIKNALQADPKNSEAHFYMALVNEKRKKFKAMKANLLEALNLDPTNLKAKLKISKVYMLFNELDKANDEVEAILATDPENLDALSIKASAYVRQEQFDSAEEIIDSILEKDSSHVDAISLKVIILTKSKAFDEAEKLIDLALLKHEKNIPLRLLKIQLEIKRNDIDAVVREYEKIARLNPNNIKVRSALAKVYLRANQKEKAENVFRAIVKDNPALLSAKVELLEFLYVLNPAEALKQLEIYRQESKENYPHLMVFAKWVIGKKKFIEGQDILTSIVAGDDVTKANKIAALQLLAKIDLSNKSYDNGLSYVEKILALDVNSESAKLLKAKVFIAKQQYNDANKVLKEILWQNPRMDIALSILGEVNVIQGDQEKAKANFKEAFKYNPRNLVALNYIVSNAVADGHVDYAIETLEGVLKYAPNNLMLVTKLVDLNAGLKKWDKAGKYIDRIQNLKNGTLFSTFLRGKLLQKQNKYDEAVVLYEEVLDKSPWFKNALFGMAESYSKMRKPLKMQKYLDVFIAKNPNIPTAYLLKSQYLSSAKKYSKAIQLLEKVINEKKADQASFYVEMAKNYIRLGKKDKQYATFIEGNKKFPADIGLLLLLASNYERDGQYVKSAAQYENVLLIDPLHTGAKNNLASLLVDQLKGSENTNKALKLVESFKQSKQPYFLDTYGWVQFNSGNIETALSVFKKVTLLAPDVPVFRYHLALAHNELSDTMSAASELKQALYLSKGRAFAEKKLTKQLLDKLKK